MEIIVQQTQLRRQSDSHHLQINFTSFAFSNAPRRAERSPSRKKNKENQIECQCETDSRTEKKRTSFYVGKT